MVCFLLFTVVILITVSQQLQFSNFNFSLSLLNSPTNPLDGCQHVYLDMGTHRGVQIRKLFEPSKFPGALVHSVFDRFFGNPNTRDNNTICAVGWEPNPVFTEELIMLEEAYRKCGWQVLIHKETGVASRNSTAGFSQIDNNPMRWAGRLVEESEKFEDTVKVETIRLAEFINEVVGKRQRPDEGKESYVVMKVDVEGREIDILPDLLLSGAIQHIDSIYIEWHYLSLEEDTAKLHEFMDLLKGIAREKNFHHLIDIESMDDETYNDYAGEYPVC